MNSLKRGKGISASRNAEIDFWKFISIMIIVLHHSYRVLGERRVFFRQGSLFVEFFFIVSGYFMALSASKMQKANIETLGSETVKFVLKKIRGILPCYIFGAIATLLGNIWLNGFDSTIMTWKLLKTPFSVLFLEMTGIPGYNITASNWYLSAMFIAMFILYPLLRYRTDLFLKVIAPVTSALLYGYMIKHDSYMGDPYLWYGFCEKGLLRAIAGLSLGCAAYAVSKWLSGKYMYKGLPTLLSIASTGSILGAIFLTYVGIGNNSQCIVILMFFVCVVIVSSRKANINPIFQNRFCAYLGKLSMAIFLTHPACARYINAIANSVEAIDNLRSLEYGDELFAAAFFIMSILLGMLALAIAEPLEKKVSLVLKNAREKGEKEENENKEKAQSEV